MRVLVTSLLVLLLSGCASRRTQQELPYDSVDCDNANGDPKLCTVEPDESRYYLEPHAAEVEWAKQVCADKPNLCEWANWSANLTQEDWDKMVREGQIIP